MSSNTNSPNRKALCAIKLSCLKDCGTLSMTANRVGIATNTALDMINEVFSAIVLYVGPKYLHLTKKNQGRRKFESLKIQNDSCF